MDLVKVYHDSGIGGFALFMPNGAEIGPIKRVVVDDQWDGQHNTARVQVTVTLDAEMVSNKPVPKDVE